MKFFRRQIKSLNLRIIGQWVFGLSVTWVLMVSIDLDRTYQDSWIMDSVWLPLAIVLISYLVYISLEDNLSRITLSTAVVAFLLQVIPGIKYHYIYGSATDQAAHFDLIRHIYLTGQVESSSTYASTPGFQAIIAQLSRFSVGSLTGWTNLFPAFLTALVPLSFYMFCRRASMPPVLSKLIIVLSAFTLPLLYLLNGTTFTVPLVIYLVVLFFLRLVSKPDAALRFQFVLLSILMGSTIILWHPPTTLVIGFTFVTFGILFSALPSNIRIFFLNGVTASIGLFCLIMGIAYWMYSADFVWLQLVRNISLFFQSELTPGLVPTRVYEISLHDQIVVFSFFHARDAVFIGLSLCGIYLSFFHRTHKPMLRILRTYSVLWAIFFAIVVAVLVRDFGAQGYRRFLSYLVALSPPLAAYGLLRVHVLIRKIVPLFQPTTSVYISIALIIFASAMQLYPYQPLVPTLGASKSREDFSPVLWFHQVNSIYQKEMLDFALNRIVTDTQLITDYVTNRQALLFFDRSTRARVLRTVNQRPEPAFLLLHWPGFAGAYTEKAEYRSKFVIDSWVTKSRVSKVYDNGGSFILYNADNARSPFTLEPD